MKISRRKEKIKIGRTRIEAEGWSAILIAIGILIAIVIVAMAVYWILIMGQIIP